MINLCNKCGKWYDDVFRWTYCPHDVFLANDGFNNFGYHRSAYLSDDPPARGPGRVGHEGKI